MPLSRLGCPSFQTVGDLFGEGSVIERGLTTNATCSPLRVAAQHFVSGEDERAGFVTQVQNKGGDRG